MLDAQDQQAINDQMDNAGPPDPGAGGMGDFGGVNSGGMGAAPGGMGAGGPGQVAGGMSSPGSAVSGPASSSIAGPATSGDFAAGPTQAASQLASAAPQSPVAQSQIGGYQEPQSPIAASSFGDPNSGWNALGWNGSGFTSGPVANAMFGAALSDAQAQNPAMQGAFNIADVVDMHQALGGYGTGQYRSGLGAPAPAMESLAGPPAAFGTNPSAYLMNGFVQRGMPPGWAAGFVGNWAQESGFNPGITGDLSIPGASHYLGQWNGPRLGAIQSYAGGTPSVDQQIEFAIGETRGTIPGWSDPQAEKLGRMIAANPNATPEEAARAIRSLYERPNPALARDDYRISQATSAFNAFGQPTQQIASVSPYEAQPIPNPTGYLAGGSSPGAYPIGSYQVASAGDMLPSPSPGGPMLVGVVGPDGVIRGQWQQPSQLPGAIARNPYETMRSPDFGGPSYMGPMTQGAPGGSIFVDPGEIARNPYDTMMSQVPNRSAKTDFGVSPMVNRSAMSDYGWPQEVNSASLGDFLGPVVNRNAMGDFLGQSVNRAAMSDPLTQQVNRASLTDQIQTVNRAAKADSLGQSVNRAALADRVLPGVNRAKLADRLLFGPQTVNSTALADQLSLPSTLSNIIDKEPFGVPRQVVNAAAKRNMLAGVPAPSVNRLALSDFGAPLPDLNQQYPPSTPQMVNNSSVIANNFQKAVPRQAQTAFDPNTMEINPQVAPGEELPGETPAEPGATPEISPQPQRQAPQTQPRTPAQPHSPQVEMHTRIAEAEKRGDIVSLGVHNGQEYFIDPKTGQIFKWPANKLAPRKQTKNQKKVA